MMPAKGESCRKKRIKISNNRSLPLKYVRVKHIKTWGKPGASSWIVLCAKPTLRRYAGVSDQIASGKMVAACTDKPSWKLDLGQKRLAIQITSHQYGFWEDGGNYLLAFIAIVGVLGNERR